jgi:hypothetical protein
MIKIVIAKGNLGNQMFGYAFYLYLKKRYKFSYVGFDIWGSLAVNIFKLSYMFSAIKIHTPDFYHAQFRFYNNRFIRKFFKVIDDNSFFVKRNSLFNIYDGYWQSQLYFDQIKDDVRVAFVFDQKLLNIRTLQVAKDIMNSNSVSIHIRRGDYLDHSEFFENICTLDYYKKAILYITNRTKECRFYVFSDDIEWCRNNIKYLGDLKFIDFNIETDSWQDMYLMSICKHNIIANSTFSWWGAWLNNNSEKMVLAPSRWMNDQSFENLIPKTWIKIDV